MPDASVLRDISVRLSEAPFAMTVSALALDEFTWPELLDFLKKVLVQVAPASRDKAGCDETVFIQYVADLAHILNFEAARDGALALALSQRNSEAIWSILHWILTNLEATKLRAYLAQFLLPVEIPGEFLDDENISSLRTTHSELQQEFQRLHSELSEFQNTAPPVQTVKEEIVVLEREKQQLSEKIASLKSRTAGETRFASLLLVTSTLRVQQEEDAKLSDKLVEQKRMLALAEEALNTAGKRYELKLKQLEKFQSKEFLAHFKAEVEGMETDQNQALIEAEELSQRLKEVQKSLGEPVPMGVLQDVEATVDRLDAEVGKLKQLISNSQVNDSDSKLAVFRQQATLAVRKREGFERELKLEAEILANVEAELRSRENKFKTIKGVKFVAKADFKQYAQSLRDKTAVFKKKQPELKFLSAEAAVLIRTEQILRDILRERGVVSTELNYANPALGMDSVSSENLAAELNELTSKLRSKKLDMTPALNTLRATRQEVEAAKGGYVRAKAVFDEKVKPLMTKLKQVHTEADSVDEAIAESTKQVRESLILEMILKREIDVHADTLAELLDTANELDVEISQVKKDILNKKDHVSHATANQEAFGKLRRLGRLKLTTSSQGVDETQRGSQRQDILQM